MTAALDTGRKQSVFLLGEAHDAALPACAGCCTEESLCADHQRWQDAADLVAAIAGIAGSAATAGEAGAAIAALLSCGTGREVTPGEREFALTAIGRARHYTLPCDDEEAALHARFDRAIARVREARTYTELGMALAGGGRQ